MLNYCMIFVLLLNGWVQWSMSYHLFQSCQLWVTRCWIWRLFNNIWRNFVIVKDYLTFFLACLKEIFSYCSAAFASPCGAHTGFSHANVGLCHGSTLVGCLESAHGPIFCALFSFTSELLSVFVILHMTRGIVFFLHLISLSL